MIIIKKKIDQDIFIPIPGKRTFNLTFFPVPTEAAAAGLSSLSLLGVNTKSLASATKFFMTLFGVASKLRVSLSPCLFIFVGDARWSSSRSREGFACDRFTAVEALAFEVCADVLFLRLGCGAMFSLLLEW